MNDTAGNFKEENITITFTKYKIGSLLFANVVCCLHDYLKNYFLFIIVHIQ